MAKPSLKFLLYNNFLHHNRATLTSGPRHLSMLLLSFTSVFYILLHFVSPCNTVFCSNTCIYAYFVFLSFVLVNFHFSQSFTPITNFSSHFIKGDHPVDCLQNANLTARVASLESCDCNPECSFKGQYFDEGDTWSKDKCTVCICKVRKLLQLTLRSGLICAYTACLCTVFLWL